MPATARPPHIRLKTGLFALLACNAIIYVTQGTLSEAIDTIAWLVLLVLFELETDFGWGSRAGWTASAARGARLVAAAAVVVAAVGYVREEEWLDAVNAALWIAIVVVLESQVRFPALAARQRATCAFMGSVLYAGLGAVAAAWLWQGEWFDAYDALLWLAALIVIETNILRRLAESERRRAA